MANDSVDPGLGGTVVQIEQPQQPFDDDEHSGEIREYSGVFEGPEKTLGERAHSRPAVHPFRRASVRP